MLSIRTSAVSATERVPPVILINNGDQAWELDQMGKTHQLAEQVRRWKVSTYYSLENLLRLRIHEPGVLIQMGGVDFLDNVATQSLDMVDAQANSSEAGFEPSDVGAG